MSADPSIDDRRAEFARNAALESLLGDLNADMAWAEAQAIKRYQRQQPRLPSVFIMGPPRSGSTLFMQWLASTGVFSYPTNLLSRFWRAPITGARIQKLLTDPQYDFRGELQDFQCSTDFQSNHGKTIGALSPNEFWYFWRRFMPGNDYRPRAELERMVDANTLRAELTGMIDVLGRPFATKGMIFNENIPFMADLLPNAIFVWIRRRPEFNAQSLLKARQRQYGDMSKWYSFRIANYVELKDLPPVQSVCGQIASIHRSIRSGFDQLPSSRTLTVDYEKFCQAPHSTYEAIVKYLKARGIESPPYDGPRRFEERDSWRLDWTTPDEVRAAYNLFADS